ncbi:MAG TPA: alkaline phosphatase PhoX [Actinomycetes bacterium]
MTRRPRLAVPAAVFLVVALTVGVAGAFTDFGSFVQQQLRDRSGQLYGVKGPLAHSSTASITAAQAAADPERLATVAKSLKVRVVSHGVAAPNLDQIALWPDDAHPTWLIVCNEQDVTDPGLVRINLASGGQEVVVTGTTECDPVRRTPWGTILFGEEAGGGPSGGRTYELVDPIHTTGVTLDRASGTFSGGSGAANLTARPALGRLSFEGLAIYGNGVTYFGDENRPGTGVAGGAYFKFIPATLRDPGAGPVTKLADSPYAVPGKLYGLRLGLRSGATDYGQGTELGLGAWVPIPPAADPDLRAQAAALKLTGYYRPEDAQIDLAAEAHSRVRFCANNTGNEPDDQLWGETICISDGTIAQAGANTGVPEVQRLVQGSPAFAMPDNIAYQPHRGNWVIHEDAETNTPLQGPHNDDLWDCLPDGTDPDLQSDGCIRVATLDDLTAEWTGGTFDASGRHFYVSVQHNVSGAGVILDITGWK